MKAAPSDRTQEERQSAEVTKVVAEAVLQRKNRQEILEDLIRRGLGEDEAREWVNRVLP